MKRHPCSGLGVLGLIGLASCGDAVDAGEAELVALGSLRQALSDPAVVFGFENTADWTVTQGSKTSSTEHSQGAASLGVSNFTFTTIVSTPLSTPAGVTDALALDLKVPATPGWGELSIFVSIPSKNVFEQKVGQVTIAGLSTGTFHSLSFTVPPSLLSTLRTSYDDLSVKIALNAPQTTQSYLLDNLHFVGVTASKVEIEMTQPIDDFFYASVDGLRQKIWYIGDPDQNGRVDATGWFAAGNHTLRLQAINTGGPASYGVRVWVDDAVVLDEQCPASTCNGQNTAEGILFDRTLSIETPARPAPQLVRVTSPSPGKLYIGDGFTGITTTGTSSPVSVSLPPGQYTFGLGVSDDSPPDYGGSYREQTVTVGSAAVDVNFGATPALPIQDETRIVVVPVRTLTVDPFNQSAVLAQADLDKLEAQLFATRDEWLEPFSYGLMTWDIDVLPVVEDVALHAPNPNDPPNAGQFLIDAELTGLRQDYELVLLYYNCFDANGNVLRGPFNGQIVDFNAAAWGGGSTVWFNPYWTNRWEPAGPNPALLHEVLHNYEQYNQFNLHFYNGVQAMHGDNEHGYYSDDNGELDFAFYQRAYMRGQVAELSSMRGDVNFPAPSARADLWVGVFDTVRGGYDPNGAGLGVRAFAPVGTVPEELAPR